MNKQAYEHVVGAVLNKKAYDWSKLLEDAKGVGQKAWEALKESYKNNPEMYHRGAIGALAGAGLGGAWKGWKGALAGLGVGGATAASVPELYKYLKDYWDRQRSQEAQGDKAPGPKNPEKGTLKGVFEPESLEDLK